MRRFLPLLLLLPAACIAQLRIYMAPQSAPGTETLVPAIHDLGSVAAGDTLETRFRVRNHGVTAASITSLNVAGSGFSVAGQPSLPYTLPPGLNLDLTVRFQARDFGAYSANLSVNGSIVLLRASASAAAVIRANGQQLTAGSSIDFGRVERDASTAIPFELANITGHPVNVRSVELTGVGFRGENIPGAVEIAGGTAVAFTLRFEPKTSGVFTGKLIVDGREIRLTGTATEPPFTRPTVVLESFAAESAQQGRVSVRFATPSRAAGNGKLSITFQPSSVADNDGAILFPSTGTRTIPLSVAAGDSAARFGDVAEAVFQTGTTAGTIVLVAEIGGYTEQTSIAIAGTAVKLDRSTAVRNGNSLELQLTGFDNTRSTGELTFTFYDRQGRLVQPGAIKADAREDFKRYFDASKLGGTFNLRATFPVAGNASEIESVEVEFANVNGSSRTPRLRF